MMRWIIKEIELYYLIIYNKLNIVFNILEVLNLSIGNLIVGNWLVYMIIRLLKFL